MSLFRERLAARLVEAHAISPELVKKLLAWRHPGFSAHVGEPITPEQKQRLEDTAAYLVRNPLSLKKLVYLDGQQAVLCRSRMNPSLGRNFEAMDPLEWLARLSDHIPDPGQHRTLFYGEYSNRVRGSGHPHDGEAQARLIAKVYQTDPLVCTRCGQRMSTIAFVTDQVSIKRILDHRAPRRTVRTTGWSSGRVRKTNASEPPMMGGKGFLMTPKPGWVVDPGRAQGEPADCLGGVRPEGGVH